MKLAVIGAGAIGGWLTSGFIEAGAEATVLARGATLEALRASGLGLNDGTSIQRYPVVATDDPADLRDADVLLLGLKAHDLPKLVPLIEAALGPQTSVAAAINGLPWWYFEAFGGPAQGLQLDTIVPGGALARLMPADRVVGAIVHAASFVETPGTIRLVAANRVLLGDAGSGGAAADIARHLARGGVPAAAADDIHREVWSKLWGNSNMNPLSAVGARIGLTGFDNVEERIETTRKLGAFRTSMLQDVEGGRTLELDSILGTLVELARKLDVPTPVMDGVYGLTRLLDQNLQSNAAQ